MKHIPKLFILAILCITLIRGGVVLAQDTTTNTTTEGSTAIQPPAPVKTDAASLEQRLQKRKTELKTKILATENQNIKLKCKASQGKVSALSSRINGIETSRTAVYKNTTDRLTKLSTKLKDSGRNTDSLNSQITELTTKINTFNTDLATYKQAVSDLAILNCVNDPLAFKASLEAARAARETLTKDSAAIRSYLTDVIKPTLVTLRGQLETDKKEGSN